MMCATFALSTYLLSPRGQNRLFCLRRLIHVCKIRSFCTRHAVFERSRGQISPFCPRWILLLIISKNLTTPNHIIRISQVCYIKQQGCRAGVAVLRIWFRHARQKIFPNHITRFVQEELPSYSVLRTSTTKVIPIKIASWIASQLEVGLRSFQLDLSYLRNNGFIKKASKSTRSSKNSI